MGGYFYNHQTDHMEYVADARQLTADELEQYIAADSSDNAIGYFRCTVAMGVSPLEAMAQTLQMQLRLVDEDVPR